uniref:ER membrane protein complex subunit 4 n=1 Tax=Tetraselmis chuii TaxID=63592 RepID=A0A7S1SMW7_9CHLO|mmetsp:Transcript_20418/g.36412  ORF Transcript_20418/g.36412 Transcript_20418/m.36412 type:complete len:171 (+) Transcript_20418:239-751(+)
MASSGNVSSKWAVTFEDASSSGRRVASPPGYDPSCSYEEVARQAAPSMVRKQQEALWARAQAPMKQVGMMCFMQWMMGNQAHLMTIIMVLGIIYNHISQIFQAGTMFKKAGPELDVVTPRLLFILIQFGGLLFAVYKLNGMGLLPTHASDWYDTSVPPVLEFSGGGAIMN